MNYQVSFEFSIDSADEKIWFAYSLPYTYSMLINFIKAIEDIQNQPEHKTNNMIYKREVIGKSLSGVEIPLITITDFSENNKRKRTIIMCSRMHPGESHASWIIHGLIRHLLSEHPKSVELRKRVVFKIIPMMNPDGVIIGNYRTTLAGCDMNRTFGESS